MQSHAMTSSLGGGRPALSHVTPFLVCGLCDGYLVDATTVTHCLHSYCRSCLLVYLQSTRSKVCPVCRDHFKTSIITNIRRDRILQKLVYKMVPGLYRDEVNRRKSFQQTASSEQSDDTRCKRGRRHRYRNQSNSLTSELYTGDEYINISLIHCDSFDKLSAVNDCDADQENPETKHVDKRYLQCPAGLTVGHLKKYIHFKFGIDDSFEVDLFVGNKSLDDNFSIIDIAYCFYVKKVPAMTLHYVVSSAVTSQANSHVTQPVASRKRSVDKSPTSVRLTSPSSRLRKRMINVAASSYGASKRQSQSVSVSESSISLQHHQDTGTDDDNDDDDDVIALDDPNDIISDKDCVMNEDSVAGTDDVTEQHGALSSYIDDNMSDVMTAALKTFDTDLEVITTATSTQQLDDVREVENATEVLSDGSSDIDGEIRKIVADVTCNSNNDDDVNSVLSDDDQCGQSMSGYQAEFLEPSVSFESMLKKPTSTVFDSVVDIAAQTNTSSSVDDVMVSKCDVTSFSLAGSSCDVLLTSSDCCYDNRVSAVVDDVTSSSGDAVVVPASSSTSTPSFHDTTTRHSMPSSSSLVSPILSMSSPVAESSVDATSVSDADNNSAAVTDDQLANCDDDKRSDVEVAVETDSEAKLKSAVEMSTDESAVTSASDQIEQAIVVNENVTASSSSTSTSSNQAAHSAASRPSMSPVNVVSHSTSSVTSTPLSGDVIKRGSTLARRTAGDATRVRDVSSDKGLDGTGTPDETTAGLDKASVGTQTNTDLLGRYFKRRMNPVNSFVPGSTGRYVRGTTGNSNGLGLKDRMARAAQRSVSTTTTHSAYVFNTPMTSSAASTSSATVYLTTGRQGTQVIVPVPNVPPMSINSKGTFLIALPANFTLPTSVTGGMLCPPLGVQSNSSSGLTMCPVLVKTGNCSVAPPGRTTAVVFNRPVSGPLQVVVSPSPVPVGTPVSRPFNRVLSGPRLTTSSCSPLTRPSATPAVISSPSQTIIYCSRPLQVQGQVQVQGHRPNGQISSVNDSTSKSTPVSMVTKQQTITGGSVAIVTVPMTSQVVTLPLTSAVSTSSMKSPVSARHAMIASLPQVSPQRKTSPTSSVMPRPVITENQLQIVTSSMSSRGQRMEGAPVSFIRAILERSISSPAAYGTSLADDHVMSTTVSPSALTRGGIMAPGVVTSSGNDVRETGASKRPADSNHVTSAIKRSRSDSTVMTSSSCSPPSTQQSDDAEPTVALATMLTNFAKQNVSVDDVTPVIGSHDDVVKSIQCAPRITRSGSGMVVLPKKVYAYLGSAMSHEHIANQLVPGSPSPTNNGSSLDSSDSLVPASPTNSSRMSVESMTSSEDGPIRQLRLMCSGLRNAVQ